VRTVAFGLVLLAASCAPVERVRSPIPTLLKAATLRLFYGGIGIETLVGITPEHLEKFGKPCIVSEPHYVGLIKGILATANPHKFLGPDSDFNARVKIYEQSERGQSLLAIVDESGATRDTSGDGWLSRQALNTLRVVIEKACGFGCDDCPPDNFCDPIGSPRCIPP
jgi:hypothetical protein